MVTLLYIAFVLSGAAGLTYESIWTRYLALFVGDSAYAQVIVLVIFLGGMSIGALLVGRYSERIRRPLLWYVAIEIATGVIGLVFHQAYVVVTGAAYTRLFPALGFGAAQAIAKWSIAGALILPQSVLLGTTFPLMSAGVIRRTPDHAGRSLALLYFSNSIGAAVGVLIAGFSLVRLVGLPGTLRTAAVLNLVVAGIVLAAVRLTGRSAAPVPQPSTRPAVALSGIRSATLWRLLLAVSFSTALSSFIYEIGWIRMLSLVLGSATHSFELMLSAFILGLALGALWIRRAADRASGSLRTLGVVQVAMGTLAIATLPVYVASFTWMAGFMSAFARTSEGYLAFSVGRYLICLAVMLPATLCAGMTLPLITRLLVATPSGEGAIGQVYGVNTLGSILGAALAGLVLLPLMGLKWLLVAGAAIDLVLGTGLLAVEARRVGLRIRVPHLATAAGGIAALVVAVGAVRFDPTVLTSGVYRSGAIPADTGQPVYYADGRTATVSVRRSATSGALTLTTNGKPDVSLGPEWLRPTASTTTGPLAQDVASQLFAPLVALAYAPAARTVAVIGQGSGMTSHILLGDSTLRHLVTIEIEPQIVEASRLFMPANRRVFEDPRSTFVIDDARAYLATQHAPFDLIVSEPSTPGVSGASGLFTTEFYARVAEHLAPGGIFAQWMHLQDVDDDLVLGVVAAIARHFPSYAIYTMSSTDILIVASSGGRLRAPDWSVIASPRIADDLRHAWPITPPTLDMLWLADNVTLGPLIRRDVVPNSDFHPTLELEAERSRFLGAEASGFAALNGGPVNLPAIAVERRSGVGAAYAVVTDVARLRAMAVGAGMRSGDPRAGPDARDAAERDREFEAEWGSGRPPADWHLWARSLTLISDARQGGMNGVADSAFFSGAMRYARDQRGPPESLAMVEFLYGLASWDFRRAGDASDVLVTATKRGDPWIPVDVLRDGAVVSKLETGDLAGARALFDGLARWSARPESDLRTRLLNAYIVGGVIGGP